MVRLVIVGPNGAMGRALVRRAAVHPSIELVGGIGPSGRDYIGLDLGLLVGLGRRLGAVVLEDLESVIDDCDVVLECTRPEVSMTMLQTCLEHRKPFGTGTTGFSAQQAKKMDRAAETVAVLRASNGSRLVHLLYDLIRTVTKQAGEGADIDIVEMHGRTKRDAPSGTAKEMGEIIASELGYDLDDIAEYGWEGMGVRARGSLHFSAIRSGGTPSTHQVIFGFRNERLELTHRAYNTEAFADGLIDAAMFASSQAGGFFTLDDVL